MAFLSNIANYLLCTPFDSKANVEQVISDKLTKTVFLESCYCNPRFLENKSYDANEESIDKHDYQVKLEDVQDQIAVQQKSYKNFINWLGDKNNYKVYTISGNAGTGKTTYIYHLSCTYLDVSWIVLDLSQSIDLITWFGDNKTLIYNFNSAYKKIYAIILREIRDLVFDGTCDDLVNGIYNKLIQLCSNYYSFLWNRYPSGHTFFENLTSIVTANVDKYKIVNDSAIFFAKYFEIVNNNEIFKDTLYDILNIFLITLRCINTSYDNNQFVIVFDNIERFISRDEIYNDEVDSIRKNLVYYSSEINKNNNCHKKIFKFIMAIRINTARMCRSKLQSSDELPSDLDLSEWFNIEDIVQKKLTWYKKENLIDINVKLIEQISSDFKICNDGKITGLKLELDPLFNNNKRLIIDFLGLIIELPSNASYLNIYENLWNEKTSLSRFTARSIIKGLVLKKLEDIDELFKKIKTYSDDKDLLGLGESRKILTILYNRLIINNDSSVTLKSVLEELLDIKDITNVWRSENLINTRKNIAEILYFMNSYDRRKNDWIQFIDLQIADESKSVVVENADEMEILITNNLNKFYLSIMPAGEAYLKYIVSSFEFFSLRYNKKYEPLFATIPNEFDMEKCDDIKNLKCYKTIQRVSTKALECIESIKNEDKIRLHFKSNDLGKSHTERIINNHKCYLDNFIKFIKIHYINNINLKDSLKIKYRTLVDACISLRNLYNF